MPQYERFKNRPRPRLSHGVHEHFPRSRSYYGRAGSGSKGKGGVLFRNIVIIGAIVGVIYIAKNGGRELIEKYLPKQSAAKTEIKEDPKAKKLEDALKNFLADVQTPPSREITMVTKSDDTDDGKEHVVKRERKPASVRDEDAGESRSEKKVRDDVPEKRTADVKPRRETKAVRPETKMEADDDAKPAITAAAKKDDPRTKTRTVAAKADTEAPAKKKVAAANAESAPKTKPAIYFIKYDEEKGNIELSPRKRPLGYKPSIKDAITALLDGPDSRERDGNIITCIPEKAYLIDAKQDGDTVYLDFNAEFEYNRLGYEGLRAQVNQIVFTATQFPGIKNVVFLINGKRRDSIGGEGFSIAKPFTRSGSALAVN